MVRAVRNNTEVIVRRAQPECDRDQMVLFASGLDEVVGPDHVVRVVDQVMDRVDWRPMENFYHQKLGEPPIHPRVLCAVILYGLICRIRACRTLEEALEVRLDFRWLAQGRSIDHSTLSEFRRKHPEQLRGLFVPLVLIGKEQGLVTFNRIAIDGTRVRAANRRTGSRTRDQLREVQENLQEEFERLSEKADSEDSEDAEVFAASETSTDTTRDASGDDDTSDRQQRLKEIEEAQAKVDAALAELETIEQVQHDFGLADAVPDVLADGLMATGENLRGCVEQNVTLYSPVPGAHAGENPAVRDNLATPVPADAIASLRNVTIDGGKEQRFDKQAFVYDDAEDVYHCPQGETLMKSSSYKTIEAGKEVSRTRYRASTAFNLQQLITHFARGPSP